MIAQEPNLLHVTCSVHHTPIVSLVPWNQQNKLQKVERKNPPRGGRGGQTILPLIIININSMGAWRSPSLFFQGGKTPKKTTSPPSPKIYEKKTREGGGTYRYEVRAEGVGLLYSTPVFKDPLFQGMGFGWEICGVEAVGGWGTWGGGGGRSCHGGVSRDENWWCD